jgi:hypothetical protein
VGRGHLEPEDILRLEDDRVVLLDQRRLPEQVEYLECRSALEVAEAIRTLAVRGAPAIGIAAAYGYALAGAQGEDLDEAAAALLASRPTAVNLPWAIREMREGGGDLARPLERKDSPLARGALPLRVKGLAPPGDEHGLASIVTRLGQRQGGQAAPDRADDRDEPGDDGTATGNPNP